MKRVLNRNIIILSALLLGMTSCAVTDFDRTADFKRYKTFGWGKAEVKVENPIYKSDLINASIKSTIQKEFAKRGIKHNTKNPDFLVSYHTYTEKKEQVYGGASPYFGYPFYAYRFHPFMYGWGGWGMPFAWNNGPSAYTYTEGTLIIDIIDAKTNDLVWRGSVSGNVNSASNVQKQIRKGIKAIFKKYPISPQNDEKLQLDENVIS
jgi:hypothetical protein